MNIKFPSITVIVIEYLSSHMTKVLSLAFYFGKVAFGSELFIVGVCFKDISIKF